jgi:hypothetical protein
MPGSLSRALYFSASLGLAGMTALEDHGPFALSNLSKDERAGVFSLAKPVPD